MTIDDPFVITDLPLLPDTVAGRPDGQGGTAEQFGPAAERRASRADRRGRFAQPVTIGPRKRWPSWSTSRTQPSLSIHNPQLWWPNGYGPQNLYDFCVRFEPDDGGVSDVKTAKIGIRKFGYQKERPFTVFCNGQKILLRGADWGMDEGMLRCDRQGFETRLRMEKDMNFNILRNCLGNVSKEDFFDLCDRYGLMVWEEFGINHETTPVNIAMFMANARRPAAGPAESRLRAPVVYGQRGRPTEPITSAMPKLVDRTGRHAVLSCNIRPCRPPTATARTKRTAGCSTSRTARGFIPSAARTPFPRWRACGG